MQNSLGIAGLGIGGGLELKLKWRLPDSRSGPWNPHIQACVQSTKFNNLNEVDQFVKIHKLPKLTAGEIEYSTILKKLNS